MSASATWLLVLAKAWGWLKSPSTYHWVKARQLRREEKARKEKAMKIALMGLILGCMLFTSCASMDKAYLWAYESLNGIPDKPMQQEAK